MISADFEDPVLGRAYSLRDISQHRTCLGSVGMVVMDQQSSEHVSMTSPKSLKVQGTIQLRHSAPRAPPDVRMRIYQNINRISMVLYASKKTKTI